jgi:hypothetical protein
VTIPRLRSGCNEKSEGHGGQYKKTLALFGRARASESTLSGQWIFVELTDFGAARKLKS